MQMNKSEMSEFATMIANAVVEALETKGLVTSKSSKVDEKTAYQKTEQLLYNYNGFKRIVEERMQEIETLKTCGLPQKSKSIVEYSSRTGTVHGLATVEESVECAIRSVQESVQGTVQAIELIDKCMDAISTDPYYEILEMRYFEGRTQEDIADYLGVSQVSVSKNKNRLVRELSIRLFPDQSIQEMMI